MTSTLLFTSAFRTRHDDVAVSPLLPVSMPDSDGLPARRNP